MNPANDYTPASAMVIVAHPDDAEFLVAGTMAKWTAAGAEATYVVVTKGDKGSEDPQMTPSRLTAIREAEQRAACDVLGVRHCVFLGYEDGYLQPTLQLRRDLTRLIRQHRPEVVVTFDPTNRFLGDNYVNHPDHRATGDATVDAIFPSARDRLTFPELLTENLLPHKVSQLWMGGAGEPNGWVDITGTLDVKKRALAAHPSQLGADIGPMAEMMARWGAAGQSFAFGEAFRRIVFDAPFELPE
jgi:LmbE family N-acetylglucosaminyl deacetylase